MQDMGLVPTVLIISLLFTAAAAQTCKYQTSKSGTPVIKNVAMQPGPIVDVGTNITLTCTASQPSYGGFDKKDSAKPNVIRWFHKEDNLIHECWGSKETPKTCQVTLQNVSLTDSGDYSCQAQNNHGCTYTVIKITVNINVALPPVFIEHPSNQTADVGGVVMLQCGVRGDQPYELQWWKNNEKLPSEASWTVTASHHDSTTMLRLGKNITDQDYGEYWCVAQNSAGTSYSRRAFLLPKQGSIDQATFTVEPRSRTAREGGRVELLCAASGFPRPVLHWQKNGSDIPNHATALERLVLRFDHVRKSDVGQYRCRATQFFGVVYSKQAALSVVTLPVVEVKPQNQSVAIGMNASLKCSAEGLPTPTITWKKIITSDFNKTVKVEKSKKSALDLIGVTEENFGVYLCEATNIAGTATSRRAVVLAKVEVGSSYKNFDDPTDVQDLVIIIVPAGFFVVLITVVAIIGVRIYTRKNRVKKESEEVIALNEIRAKRLAHPHPSSRTNSPGPTRPLLATRDHLQEKGERDECSHPPCEGCQTERMVHGQGSDIRQHKSKPLSTAVYMNLLGVSMDWELDRTNLRILDESLGQGEFGVVKKGLYLRRDGQYLEVAVKMLKDENHEDDRQDLMQELNTLKKVGRHDNIVCLVGSCTQGPVCVVLEFVAGGNLEDLLRASLEATLAKPNIYTNQLSEFSERQLLQFSADTACGMRHLESHQVVHRDLAARNVLLDTNTMVAKVADFGLARDVSASEHGKYIKRSNGRVPWKWTALESLRDGHSSSKSDAWSFGVVLWEISTLGTEPYPGESNVVSLHARLVKGYRMSRPSQCSHEIYELMCACWEADPDQRPSFEEIHRKIMDMLRDEKRTYINVEHYRELLTEQVTDHVIQ